MHFVDEYQRFGFRPSEIVGLLKAHEISIDLGDKATSDDVSGKRFPEWKRIMSLEPSLTLGDWIFALIDVDPYNCGFHDDFEAEFQRYEDLLRRAILRRDLPATECTTKKNEQTWQIAAHAFQAWCEAKGIDYPLPSQPAYSPHHTETPTPCAPQSPPSRWPWGNHTTKALELLADVAKQWWSTYDPDDTSTAPTNKEVIDYVVAKGESAKLGDSIASMLRADGLRTGRRKGSGE